MAIRPLSVGQLIASVEIATGQKTRTAFGTFGQRDPDVAAQTLRRRQFAAAFRRAAGNAKSAAGIPQALALMNGELVSQATSPATSPLLQSIQAPFFSARQRLDVLFLATLARFPDNQEVARLNELLDRAPTSDRRRELESDILWALLNSAEFSCNH